MLTDARGAHQASASRPAHSACATRLISDWSDGRIDRQYPIGCYRSALKSLPSDLKIYSSAPDDISQALSQRILQSRSPADRGSTQRGSRTLAGHAAKR